MTLNLIIDRIRKKNPQDAELLHRLKVKGYVLEHTLKYVEDTFGDEKKEILIRNLDLQRQILLRKVIQVEEWYQFADLLDISRTMCKVFYDGDRKQFEEVGFIVASYKINFMDKLKLKYMKSKAVPEVVVKFYQEFYLNSSIEVVSIKDGFHEYAITDLYDPTKIHMQRLKGNLRYLYDQAGISNITEEVDSTERPTVLTVTF